MANTANLHDAAAALDLGHIRQSLRRMEDSIIFSLIERTQFRINHKVYEPDCEEKIYPPQLLSPSLPPLPVPSPAALPALSICSLPPLPPGTEISAFNLHQLKSAGSDGCLGDYFIYQTECLHSQARRYKHPTEYAFFGPLPQPTLSSTSGAPTTCSLHCCLAPDSPSPSVLLPLLLFLFLLLLLLLLHGAGRGVMPRCMYACRGAD
jgi:hypothetical protein